MPLRLPPPPAPRSQCRVQQAEAAQRGVFVEGQKVLVLDPSLTRGGGGGGAPRRARHFCICHLFFCCVVQVPRAPFLAGSAFKHVFALQNDKTCLPRWKGCVLHLTTLLQYTPPCMSPEPVKECRCKMLCHTCDANGQRNTVIFMTLRSTWLHIKGVQAPRGEEGEKRPGPPSPKPGPARDTRTQRGREGPTGATERAKAKPTRRVDQTPASEIPNARSGRAFHCEP